MRQIERYFKEFYEIQKQYLTGEISWDEGLERIKILRYKIIFPKLGQILENDLLEQKRINDEFGYMGREV